MLPSAIGTSQHDPRKIKAPSYSLAASLDKNHGNKNPGPSHYRVDVLFTRQGKDGTARYSLGAR